MKQKKFMNTVRMVHLFVLMLPSLISASDAATGTKVTMLPDDGSNVILYPPGDWSLFRWSLARGLMHVCCVWYQQHTALLPAYLSGM